MNQLELTNEQYKQKYLKYKKKYLDLKEELEGGRPGEGCFTFCPVSKRGYPIKNFGTGDGFCKDATVAQLNDSKSNGYIEHCVINGREQDDVYKISDIEKAKVDHKNGIGIFTNQRLSNWFSSTYLK